MTTNIEHTTEVVRDCLTQAWNAGPIFDTRKFPDAAARALADAGLLMPDLPRPTSDMLHAHWDMGTTIIRTGYGGTVIVEWQPEPDNAVAIFTPDQVKAIFAAHLHRDRWREREERMEKELNDHHAEQENKKMSEAESRALASVWSPDPDQCQGCGSYNCDGSCC